MDTTTVKHTRPLIEDTEGFNSSQRYRGFGWRYGWPAEYSRRWEQSRRKPRGCSSGGVSSG